MTRAHRTLSHCGRHDDIQEMSFQCPKVLEKIKSLKIITYLKNKIFQNLAKTISSIMELRRKGEINLSGEDP